MLARAGRCVGDIRCPRPCLGRKATFAPETVPVTIESLGLPNGVSISSSRRSVSPGKS